MIKFFVTIIISNSIIIIITITIDIILTVTVTITINIIIYASIDACTPSLTTGHRLCSLEHLWITSWSSASK